MLEDTKSGFKSIGSKVKLGFSKLFGKKEVNRVVIEYDEFGNSLPNPDMEDI